MSVKFIVDESCYEVLQKNNPKMLEAVANLVDGGVTPDSIYKMIFKQSPSFADWCRGAASHMVRNKGVRPTQQSVVTKCDHSMAEDFNPICPGCTKWLG